MFNELVSLCPQDGWQLGIPEGTEDGLNGRRRLRTKPQRHVRGSHSLGESPVYNSDGSSNKTSSPSDASPYTPPPLNSTQTTISTDSSTTSELTPVPSDFNSDNGNYQEFSRESLNNSHSAGDQQQSMPRLILKLRGKTSSKAHIEKAGEEEDSDYEETIRVERPLHRDSKREVSKNKSKKGKTQEKKKEVKHENKRIKKRKGGSANSESGRPKRPKAIESPSVTGEAFPSPVPGTRGPSMVGETADKTARRLEDLALVSPTDVQPQPRPDHGPGMQPPVDFMTTPEGRDMAELSRKLMAISTSKDKPDSMGLPEVWADGRQALCETLPYYRGYQCAGYCTGGYACAFMFDKHSGERDYMDVDVVLSLSGGGRSRDETSGSMVRSKDQTLTKQVQDLEFNIRTKSAVALIVGQKNPNIPSKVPHAYCVMDWFKPTHIWSEKEDGRVVFRYRFEKLKPEKASWWAPSNQEIPKVGSLQPPEEATCNLCQKPSPKVYLQGWMCLHRECKRFWKLPNGLGLELEPVEKELVYDPRFLKQHTEWPHAAEPQPLRPEPMVLDGAAPTAGQAISWVAWKGFVCPKCGRCSSRESWNGWKCGNTNCNFEHKIPHTIIPPTAFRDYYSSLTSAYAPSKDHHAPEVQLELHFLHNYRIHIYRVPGVDGFVAHYMANKSVNEEQGGPDDMFTGLQTDLEDGKIDLRRRLLSSTTLRGGQLTQHFCLNYGMYYKFVAQTASESFDTAPAAVKNTRSRLNWVARHALQLAQTPNPSLDFNEELLIGYFEKQAIDYHDDGEAGLGPTIASLSLGWPAPMKLRMKEKHHNGMSKGGHLVTDKPMPGCEKYAERMGAWQELETLKAAGEASAAAYKQRVKELPKELGLKAKGNARDVVTLQLRHGDVMLMHGADIQKYYEHAVVPDGALRFALTCRYIDPLSLPENIRPRVGPDTENYDGAALPEPPK